MEAKKDHKFRFFQHAGPVDMTLLDTAWFLYLV